MDDISKDELFYGSPTAILQGKMTRFRPKGARIERLPLPLPLYQHHKDLQLYIDLFFVNSYPFIATKTKKVDFITAKPCILRGNSHINKSIDTVLELYVAIYFNINAVHGDNKFNIKTLKAHLIPI